MLDSDKNNELTTQKSKVTFQKISVNVKFKVIFLNVDISSKEYDISYKLLFEIFRTELKINQHGTIFGKK